MLLSHESYRVRWFVLVAVWSLAAFGLYKQAGVVENYLALTGSLGLRGAPAPTTAMKETYPAFAADGQVWVRHAVALIEGKDLRLRYTTIDNAPLGREVHWNSAWAWAIAGSGWVYHLITGDDVVHSVEKGAIWLNPTALLILTILLSAWATKRGGLMLGLLVVAVLVTNDRVYEGFFPSYVDHHGLLTVAVFGLVLGAVMMGGGWWQANEANTPRILPDSAETARSAAVFSAVAGACGLWVSAASVIPPIALVGIAALVTNIIHGRSARQQGATFDGAVWRLWGRAGAISSMIFYLLEYFPQHLSFRLEPNHPLHAIAWLGGGELIAQLSERWLAPQGRRWSDLNKLVWPVLAVAAVPAVVLMGGPRVFSVLDPFMSRLHNDYIQEFLPIWRTFRTFSGSALLQTVVLGGLPLIAAIAMISYKRRETSIVLLFATIASVFFMAMAVGQSRWLLNATGTQMCLAFVVLGVWLTPWRPVVRWSAALAVIGIFLLPSAVIRYTGTTAQVKNKQVAPGDASAAFNRDLAAALRGSQPEGEITLLSSPNSSTAIGYYGRFKTLGTLYWENTAGLKAAASIWGARSEEEAATLIRAHKVTHIALVAQENFIEQYYRLLHPNAKDEDVRRCFGLRVFADRIVPQWLQMIPYKVPGDLTSLKPAVMLFKVNFSQTMPEALYNIALAQIAAGSVDEGERALDQLLKIAPQVPEPWLRKGELLMARRAWADSAEHSIKGISLAAPQNRAPLYATIAAGFYNIQQVALAARVYRAAVADQPTPELISYLAWILSTSTDDSLRNGKEALEFAQLAVKADPTSPSYLSVLSAALAELGRFPEAVQAADRALANSSIRKDAPTLQQEFAQRLAFVKAGRPLRHPVIVEAPAPGK